MVEVRSMYSVSPEAQAGLRQRLVARGYASEHNPPRGIVRYLSSMFANPDLTFRDQRPAYLLEESAQRCASGSFPIWTRELPTAPWRLDFPRWLHRQMAHTALLYGMVNLNMQDHMSPLTHQPGTRIAVFLEALGLHYIEPVPDAPFVIRDKPKESRKAKRADFLNF